MLGGSLNCLVLEKYIPEDEGGKAAGGDSSFHSHPAESVQIGPVLQLPAGRACRKDFQLLKQLVLDPTK